MNVAWEEVDFLTAIVWSKAWAIATDQKPDWLSSILYSIKDFDENYDSCVVFYEDEAYRLLVGTSNYSIYEGESDREKPTFYWGIVNDRTRNS